MYWGREAWDSIRKRWWPKGIPDVTSWPQCLKLAGVLPVSAQEFRAAQATPGLPDDIEASFPVPPEVQEEETQELIVDGDVAVYTDGSRVGPAALRGLWRAGCAKPADPHS